MGLLALSQPLSVRALELIRTVNGDKVTASIPDRISPDPPILISPPDGSVVGTQTPTFTWYATTDNVGVDHYQLVIDGVVVLDTLPFDTLTATPETELELGSHTWSVVAFDTASNAATSATWNFSIGTPTGGIIASPQSQLSGWAQWLDFLRSAPALWLWLLGPILAWFWWLLLWGKSWLGAGWVAWWAVLGWLRPKRQGWTLESKVVEAAAAVKPPRPLAWVKITVFGRTLTSLTPVPLETIFSDQTGQFALPHWPLTASAQAKLIGPGGQYFLTFGLPDHPLDFTETPLDWPKVFTPFTYWHHRYHGGWLSLRPEFAFPTLICFLKKTEKVPGVPRPEISSWFASVGAGLTSWSQQQGMWWWLVWLGGLSVSLVWGGWWNWVVVGHTSAVGLYRCWQWWSGQTWRWHLPVAAQGGQATVPLNGVIITSLEVPAEAWWLPIPPKRDPYKLELAMPKTTATAVLQYLSDGGNGIWSGNGAVGESGGVGGVSGGVGRTGAGVASMVGGIAGTMPVPASVAQMTNQVDLSAQAVPTATKYPGGDLTIVPQSSTHPNCRLVE